jgi:hypothetical protein
MPRDTDHLACCLVAELAHQSDGTGDVHRLAGAWARLLAEPDLGRLRGVLVAQSLKARCR